MTRLGRSAVIVATLVAAGALAACQSASAPAGRTARDSRDDGLFHDFLDGKYDGAGHPLGATVLQGEEGCTPATGAAEAEGWGAHPGDDAPGVLCRGAAGDLGAGSFTLNLRALVPDRAPGDHATVVTLRARDDTGTVLAEREVPASELLTPLTYQNLPLRFRSAGVGPILVEVDWPGTRAVRIDYLEVFRSSRQLILAPASGELAESAQLQLELTDPPTGASFRVSCDEVDRTEALAALLADGTATWETTEFRALVTVPAAALLDGCPLPTRLRVSAVTGSWVRETSRVTYRAAPPPCAFADTGTRVLLTGFEPFPADSSTDNSSEHAVQGFDPTPLDDVTLMRLTLPVEYDSAAAWVTDVIDRCQPEVVIGFGQGRSAVDLETTAYNVKDTSEISGGVPDNRGVILGGEAIDPEGPAEVASGLPLERILDGLRRAGIEADLSDDPGRYICNNVFYTIVRAVAGTPRVGGFVHLPRIYTVDEEAQRRLQTIVATTVTEAVALRRSR